jgi:signal transduction histidine kinase
MVRGDITGDITGGLMRSMTVRGRLATPVVLALIALAIAAALASVLSITGLTSPPPLTETTAMIRALAAPAFLAAGVLRLALWRITGERECGLRAVAMLLMGGICLPSVALARGLSDPGEGLATITCVRALSLGAILYVMAVALSGDTVDRAPLGRRIVGLTATGGALTGLLLSEHDRLPPEPSLQLVLSQGVAGALAIAWLTVSVGAMVKGRHEDWARPTAPLLAAMGIAELFRIPDRPVTTLVAAALTAAVGFLVASSALLDLVRGAQDEHHASAGLTFELASALGAVSDRDAWRDDLTHDARSTLAGIRAAMQTLDRRADDLDPADADRLRVATLAELTHLEQMFARHSAGDDAFDVADVVRTVTDVRRAAGSRIEVALCSAQVRGVRSDLATALQNLLVNAGDHAPGASVRVVVRTTGDLVQVVVEDDGPGIPAARAGAAFDRGVRGPDSDGSGLGLSISRALVRRNGGDLELCRTERGTTFVVSLPLAVSTGSGRLVSVAAAS